MDEKTKNKITQIIKFSKLIRGDILNMSFKTKTAHLASSMSCVDIIATIYTEFLNINKKYFTNNFRNRFILSKGHAASSLYSVLYRKKILSKKNFNSYCKVNSSLEEHPSIKIKGVECATGSLGHGLPVGCGIALAYKIRRKKNKVYILVSDGECNEGSVWEAALFASSKKLNNLILIVDYNKWQATERSDVLLGKNTLKKKFEAFGWNAKNIDGHNHYQIYKALKINNNSQKPIAIIANTTKGKGVDFMEDDNNWHYKSPNQNELDQSLKQIFDN
jgi:transketolase